MVTFSPVGMQTRAGMPLLTDLYMPRLPIKQCPGNHLLGGILAFELADYCPAPYGVCRVSSRTAAT